MNIETSMAQMTLVPSAQPAHVPSQSFRFMDLPRELRLVVYDELVVVGKIFYTPDFFEIEQGARFKDHKEYPRPHLNIFRVSKTIRDEAEPLYLANNLFVLPKLWYWRDPIYTYPQDVTGTSQRMLFSASSMPKIKHISIAFCKVSEVPLTMNHADWKALESRDPGAWNRMSPPQRLGQAHASAIGYLESDRSHIWSGLHLLTGVQSLEIDLTNAYCPLGCCRRLELDGRRLAIVGPKKLRIRGLRDEGEVEVVMGEWSAALDMSEEEVKETYGVEIDPEEDPWEQWKMDGANPSDVQTSFG